MLNERLLADEDGHAAADAVAFGAGRPAVGPEAAPITKKIRVVSGVDSSEARTMKVARRAEDGAASQGCGGHGEGKGLGGEDHHREGVGLAERRELEMLELRMVGEAGRAGFGLEPPERVLWLSRRREECARSSERGYSD